MLDQLIGNHRDAMVARLLEGRRGVRPQAAAPDDGESMAPFPAPLTGKLPLAEVPGMIRTPATFAIQPIDVAGKAHGAEVWAAGLDVAQIVRDYGGIRQAIVEIADRQDAPVSVEELRTLNRCLDTAIVEGVTEHARLAAERRSREDVERLGQAAHELRDLLNAALLAFGALERTGGTVDSKAGAVLGRSLTGLRSLVERMLSGVRITAAAPTRRRLTFASFIDEVAATALLHSKDRGVRLTVAPVDPDLPLDADPQSLASAVMNLLQNAFKNTPRGGLVTLTARAEGDRLLIEIQDECGGIQARLADLFQPFTRQQGPDGSGLGLGLSMARDAARAHGGDIRVRNMPGYGCVFTIDLPAAASVAPAREGAAAPGAFELAAPIGAATLSDSTPTRHPDGMSDNPH